MFDFYLGAKEDIQRDEAGYLLSVKRMLPRWCNGIPDSEYLALYDLISANLTGKPMNFIETGVGASTIMLYHFAAKTGGRVFSWDTNALKASYLRGVITETLNRYHRANLDDTWTFVGFDSISPHLGLPILQEFKTKIDFTFFDSEHTSQRLLTELKMAIPSLADNAIVAIDDGNYDYVYANTAFINIQRKKLGLATLDEGSLKDNKGPCFWQAVEGSLKENFNTVEHVEDTYKTRFREDLFFAYFKNEKSVIATVGMEKMDNLSHRFDAWRVRSRRQ